MCAVFKQNVKNFIAIAHKKIFTSLTARNAVAELYHLPKSFTDTNLLVVLGICTIYCYKLIGIGERRTKKFY